MKSLKLMLVSLLLVLPASESAWADHGHVRIGVAIGPYWGAPWHYPPPYYYPPPYPVYYPPVVVERPAPPVYVEQQEVAPPPSTAAAPPASSYWYYCVSARAYYPYVKTCPEAWQKVPPQPAGQP